MTTGSVDPQAADCAIQATGLVKKYGEFTAVNNVDVCVPAGTVLGLLGPNGAGKTTTVKMLTTLTKPTAGQITVAGVDVLTQPGAAKRRMGVSGQYAAVDEYLTGYENLYLVGRLYHFSAKEAKRRAHELLDQFSLTDAGGRQSKTYSGGMRRRLDLAAALVANPPVIFLDEPTTGLDPKARMDMWGVIRDLVREGTTLLLTTQYLEEADELADSIMVIDHGSVIAEGTATELKTQVGGQRLEAAVVDPADLAVLRQAVDLVADGRVVVDEQRHSCVAQVRHGQADLATVMAELTAAGVTVAELGVRPPTMDDVFLTLTGAHATETGQPDGVAATDAASTARTAEEGAA